MLDNLERNYISCVNVDGIIGSATTLIDLSPVFCLGQEEKVHYYKQEYYVDQRELNMTRYVHCGPFLCVILSYSNKCCLLIEQYVKNYPYPDAFTRLGGILSLDFNFSKVCSTSAKA